MASASWARSAIGRLSQLSPTTTSLRPGMSGPTTCPSISWINVHIHIHIIIIMIIRVLMMIIIITLMKMIIIMINPDTNNTNSLMLLV